MKKLAVAIAMVVSLNCGGKKTESDASSDSSKQNVCRWMAWDGKAIECPPTGGKLTECTAPGPNGCGNYCGCVDPASNHYECTSYPAPSPCPLK